MIFHPIHHFSVLKVTFLLVVLSLSFSAKAQKECGSSAKELFGENVFIFNLGDKINTKYNEYNPVLSPNGEFMLFTARRDSTTGERIYAEDGDYYEDIMISEMENGRFRNANILKPENHIFPAPINTNKHEAPVFLSPDSKTLIIYKADKLWYSNKTDEGYTLPVEYGKNINVGNYQRHASIIEDGSAIYFTAEVKGYQNNEKNLDILVSYKQEDGSWGAPIVAPGLINTRYNEDSPEISKDGKTMFFSSDKPGGFGGYDIYKTELIDGTWTEPVNVCKPINSAANDVFFKLSDDGSYAYLSSNRLGGFGHLDIYKVVIDKPKFENCAEYNAQMMDAGLIMAGRDTITTDQRVTVDGSSTKINGIKPSTWYWKNGEHVVSKKKSYEPDFTIPGVYEVSMQVGFLDEEKLTLSQQCATKKLVVLEPQEYERYVNDKSSYNGLKALVGQDEMLLSFDEGVGSNPFDLVPEAENTFVNTPLDIYVLANDKHPLGSDLKLIQTEKPEFGLANIKDSDEGVVHYQPEKDFVGIDKFFYYAQDDAGQKAKSFVAVQVLDAKSYMNEQAVRNDKSTTQRDSSVSVDVMKNDVHPFGYTQKIGEVSAPKFGTVEVIDAEKGIVKYTPKPGFVGKDAFTYTAIDQFGASSAALVEVVVGDVVMETINAIEDFKYTQADKPVAFCVTANDSPEVPKQLRVTGITQPSFGSVKILNPIEGTILYRPKNGFSGTDVFTYNVVDERNNKGSAAVTIVVAPTQGTSAIAAEPDQEKIQEGEKVAMNLLANDDLSKATKLNIASIDQPKHGTLIVKDSIKGLIEYVPNEGFAGFEYFSYTIIDDKGNKAKSMVEIEVLKDGEMLLSLADDRSETQLNEAVTIRLFDNDKHSAKSMKLASVEQPAHGKVTIIDAERGIVKYVPDFGYGGKDFFTYTALDSEGNSASAKANITVIEPILMANIDTKNLPDLHLIPIYFDFDKSFIREDARKIMDENIRVLKENPDLIIKVLSHCDSRGSRKYNIQLSERRARATVKYMTDRGISKERILAVVGLGESELVNDCGDGVYCPNSDHQKNRRSDMVIVGRNGK